ncbi:UDP-N-acetylmuramoyl-tripeptide--D-alanyl-D-alanine ligase (EC [Olavius algarvensis associated proteobacterium Delta 3]|nr:UDP-N-acetylmuramoyl-tripeptide--D-alanyl-D-alanine ligase (EC [Olavius algarvensis associated proteobacterium Delta 3]
MQQATPWTWTGTNILEATGGTCVAGAPDAVFGSIETDSRAIPQDALFVAIRGETHDGHRFVEEAVSAGVRGVVISEAELERFPVSDWAVRGIFCVSVPDTMGALGQLATFIRRLSAIPVVAITGSNGKTSTREMIVSVMSRRYRTLFPERNFNNEVGVPLTLFRLRPDHQWAVLELGMNHFGEIARLTRMCDPDIGVITNIGPAHLEGVGSIEGVMAAKGELLDEMAADKRAVLNADDPRIRTLAERAVQKTLMYGWDKDADIRAETMASTPNGMSFDLDLAGTRVPIRLNTPGPFMVSNALAAAAVGYLAGLTPNEIREGLDAFRPVQGRLNVRNTAKGIHIIDDTYNANPASMAAAIETLQGASRAGRSVMVAGDMKELGNGAADLHRDIGLLCARSNITRLYAAGEFAEQVGAGAAEGGMPPEAIVTGSRTSIADDLVEWLEPGDWIVVKGSRAMGMEKVVARLLEWAGENTK